MFASKNVLCVSSRCCAARAAARTRHARATQRFFGETPPPQRGQNAYGQEAIVIQRTGLTRKIWELRKSNLIRDKSKEVSGLQAKPHPKTPTDSELTVDLEFSRQEIRQEYVRHDGGVRLGKILEDMDAMAGNVAHQHADDGNSLTAPLHVVTALCDRIDLLQRFPMNRDLCMRGRVTWVGRSSLNIMVDIFTKHDPSDRVLEAQFLMVCRDPFKQKAVEINSLKLETEEQRMLFKAGVAAKKDRKVRAAASLDVTVPSPEEMIEIHKFFTDKGDHPIPGRSFFDLSRDAPGEKDSVYISNTKLESVMLTQPQEMNYQNKIFGGYLMRKAFELARTSAYVFGGVGVAPFALSVDDVMFFRPVEIGSVIKFDSRVAYSPGPPSKSCSIQVDTEILDLATGIARHSNSFGFTFASATVPFRRVIPQTYEEAMDYITGKRSIERGREAHTQIGSTLADYF